MVDPRPSDRRLTRLVIFVLVLGLAVVGTVLVAFDMADYHTAKNERRADAVLPG